MLHMFDTFDHGSGEGAGEPAVSCVPRACSRLKSPAGTQNVAAGARQGGLGIAHAKDNTLGLFAACLPLKNTYLHSTSSSSKGCALACWLPMSENDFKAVYRQA